MRTSFIRTLTEMARQDERIMLLTGDLGFSVFEGFAREFPDRFRNMGISEANMVGAAAGLAMSGKVVYVYSIVPFVTMRCFEQVRVDACYHNLNIKLIGVGGGFSYGQSGPTHHSIEDIALMRVLPNMKVLCPGDPMEAVACTKVAAEVDGPVYIRLGKNGEKALHAQQIATPIGGSITVREGKHLTLLATGNMLETAVAAAEQLAKRNLSARVISMYSVKPLDEVTVRRAIAETPAIFTLEEHNRYGGLGSAVAEVLAEETQRRPLFRRFAVPDAYTKRVGSQEYLRQQFGLDTDHIVGTILSDMARIFARANGTDGETDHADR